MKDKKHLSQDRVKYFAKNLKAAFFNTKPWNDKRKPIRKSNQFEKNQREFPRRRNPKPMSNQYNPVPQLPTPTLPYQFPPQFPAKSQFNSPTLSHQQTTAHWFANNTKPSPPLP